MTMAEIRKELKNLKNFEKCKGHKEMVAFYELMSKYFEDLYKSLIIKDVPHVFMCVAKGYQIRTGNYKTVHIVQTHDLYIISCDSKKVARDFFQWWVLN